MTDWYKINRELIRVNEEYNDMQWPCPDGFHVPLKSEWEWLNTIMSWLWFTNWEWFKSNLHMPYWWWRNQDNSNTENQWTNWYYLCSNRYDDGTYRIYNNNFHINSSTASLSGNYISFWQSIRPFYNVFVTPTSSWTVIQWTLGSAWIFWNQTDWLISITSNWTTWYTIQDKNLWATTVYNSWDTLSEANCWYYYQWWNNYWFAWTWSVTTSSTQVDASTYWPWNYYSSSTFYVGSAYYPCWDRSFNWNLRWWISQWSWTRYVEKQIYPTSRLPSDYQEVEYIQSSGNWTNTWQFIKPNVTVAHRIKIKFWRQWSGTSSDNEREVYATYGWTSNQQFWFSPYSWAFITNGVTATRTPSTYSNPWTYEATVTWYVANSRPPFLFWQNEWDSYARWNITMKLYYFQVYQTSDDTLIRDFVPCYRKSDSVIWLYDIVNDTFYTNQWSWTFTKWPDVN